MLVNYWERFETRCDFHVLQLPLQLSKTWGVGSSFGDIPGMEWDEVFLTMLGGIRKSWWNKENADFFLGFCDNAPNKAVLKQFNYKSKLGIRK